MSKEKNLSFSEKRTFLSALEKIVKEAGEQILTQRGTEIGDTHDFKGHESSVIDAFAREKIYAAIERHLHHFEGIIRTELLPFIRTLIEVSEHNQLVLIIDEIEGTTNTKRCLTANLEYRPLAAVSVALSLSESLKDLVVGAVYTLDRGEVFSAFRVDENDFLAFHNHRRIDPEEVIHIRGDSKKRVLVIGYSNSHRLEKGELEQVLYDQEMKTYEGCRASGMDIVNLLRNHSDAYIDLRHYWSTKDSQNQEKEAMLQIYDIAGIVPIAEGCGLKVTDAEGKSWKDYNLDDTIPLIVSRPAVHQEIINAIKPLVEKWKGALTKGEN
jgi:fructose-1,6-bisphosphatase/inositol monophosphatase family enzyme